jgi:purine-binding chemotaxis protein CheW
MSETRQFCTLSCGGHLFAVPVEEVQEVIAHQPMTQVPLAPGVVAGLINLRGQIVTAIDLRDRLEFPPAEDRGALMNVVIQTASGTVSLLVDAIGDVVEADPALHETPPQTLTGQAKQLIRAVYKTDGQVLLELDTKKTVNIGAVDAAA